MECTRCAKVKKSLSLSQCMNKLGRQVLRSSARSPSRPRDIATLYALSPSSSPSSSSSSSSSMVVGAFGTVTPLQTKVFQLLLTRTILYQKQRSKSENRRSRPLGRTVATLRKLYSLIAPSTGLPCPFPPDPYFPTFASVSVRFCTADDDVTASKTGSSARRGSRAKLCTISWHGHSQTIGIPSGLFFYLTTERNKRTNPTWV